MDYSPRGSAKEGGGLKANCVPSLKRSRGAPANTSSNFKGSAKRCKLEPRSETTRFSMTTRGGGTTSPRVTNSDTSSDVGGSDSEGASTAIAPEDVEAQQWDREPPLKRSNTHATEATEPTPGPASTLALPDDEAEHETEVVVCHPLEVDAEPAPDSNGAEEEAASLSERVLEVDIGEDLLIALRDGCLSEALGSGSQDRQLHSEHVGEHAGEHDNVHEDGLPSGPDAQHRRRRRCRDFPSGISSHSGHGTRAATSQPTAAPALRPLSQLQRTAFATLSQTPVDGEGLLDEQVSSSALRHDQQACRFGCGRFFVHRSVRMSHEESCNFSSMPGDVDMDIHVSTESLPIATAVPLDAYVASLAQRGQVSEEALRPLIRPPVMVSTDAFAVMEHSSGGDLAHDDDRMPAPHFTRFGSRAAARRSAASTLLQPLNASVASKVVDQDSDQLLDWLANLSATVESVDLSPVGGSADVGSSSNAQASKPKWLCSRSLLCALLPRHRGRCNKRYVWTPQEPTRAHAAELGGERPEPDDEEFLGHGKEEQHAEEAEHAGVVDEDEEDEDEEDEDEDEGLFVDLDDFGDLRQPQATALEHASNLSLLTGRQAGLPAAATARTALRKAPSLRALTQQKAQLIAKLDGLARRSAIALPEPFVHSAEDPLEAAAAWQVNALNRAVMVMQSLLPLNVNGPCGTEAGVLDSSR